MVILALAVSHTAVTLKAALMVGNVLVIHAR